MNTPPGQSPIVPPRQTSGTRVPRAERRARLRRQRRLVGGALIGAVAVVLLLLFTVGPFGSHLARPGKPPLGYLREPLGGRSHRVTAWTPGSVDSLAAAAAASAVDEIGFDWYHTQADGSVTAEHEDPELVAAAREHELNLFATVTNTPGAHAAFDREIAAGVLTSPERRDRFVSACVDLVKTMGYDGIDLDWEDLRPADRDGFSLLIEKLAKALHAEGRFLSIAVMPKTSEPGEWDNQRYADWPRLGKAIDSFKIMTYSFSGPWGGPGPQTPLRWADKVLRLAERTVPPEKVSMGVPFFGFDWHGDSCAAVSAHRGAGLVETHGAHVTREPSSKEATMTFNEGGETHHVIFQDEAALAAKLQVVRRRHPEIAGISIWVMGQEIPAFWPLITRKLR